MDAKNIRINRSTTKLYDSAFSSFAKNQQEYWKDREEEEEEKRKKQGYSNLTDGKKDEENKGNGILSKIGETAKGLPGALVESYNTLGTGLGELAYDATGGNEREAEQRRKANEHTLEVIKSYKKLLENGTPEQKKRAKKGLANLIETNKQRHKNTNERLDEIIERTDPSKQAGAMASIGLDVATAGTAGAAIKGGRAALKTGRAATKANKAENIKNSSKIADDNKLLKSLDNITNPTGIKQSAKSGAVLGSAYGATGTLEDKGSEANVGDYAKGVATGAVVGTAIGGTLGGVLKGVQKVLNSKSSEELSSATNEVVKEAKEQKAIGPGFRTSESIEQEMQSVRDGADDSLYRYTDSQGNDVTSKVANYDQEITARKAAIRDLEQQSEGVDNVTGTTTPPEGVDPSEFTGDTMGRVNAREAISKLQSEIDDLTSQQQKAFDSLGGVSKNLDNDAVRNKWSSLQEELKQTKEYEFNIQRQNYDGDTPAQAQAKIAALESGEYPDEIMQPDKIPESVADIFSNNKMPDDLRFTAEEIMDDIVEAENMLSNLMTKKRYNKEVAIFDKAYNKKLEQIQDMPAPRQELEMEKLNQKYLDDIEEADAALEGDEANVEHYDSILQHLSEKEEELVEMAKMEYSANESKYRTVNDDLLKTERERLEENLQQAQTFAEPARTIERVTESGQDLAEVARNNPDVNKDVVAKIANDTMSTGYKKSSGIRRAVLNFLSDSNNFEAMGLRKIHTDIIRAEQVNVTRTKEDMKLIKEVADAIKRGEITNDQIVDFTQGKLKQPIENPRTAELVQKLLGDKADVIRKKVYEDTLSNLRKKNSKRKNPRSEREMLTMATEKANKATIDNYFPHIDLDSTTSQFARAANKGDNASEVSFGNLKHREKNSDKYSRDVVNVLTAYVAGFNKKMYLEPALMKLQEPDIIKKMHKREEDYVKGYISKVLNRDTGRIEESVNGVFDAINEFRGKKGGGNEYRKMLGAQRTLSATAALGGSVRSVLVNFTQATNGTIAIGADNMLVGSKRMTDALIEYKRTGEIPPDLQAAVDAGVFDTSAVAALGDELESIVNNGASAKSRMTKGADVLLSGMQYSDRVLRGSTFMGAMRMAEKKGLKGQEALDFAAEKVIDTQFITSRIDMPKNFNGPGVRSLTQLASFSIKQAEFLGKYGIKTVKLSKKEGGGYRLEDPTQMWRTLQGATVGAGFTALLAPIGFQAEEWIPFKREIAEGKPYMSPIARIVLGDEGKVGLKDLIWSGDKTKSEQAVAFWEDNWQNLTPGGAQIKRSVEGFSSTMAGESNQRSGLEVIDPTTPGSGNTRFIQESDPLNQFRASVFGQYSTESGKRWIQEGFPTLTDSEMRLKQSEDEAKESGVTFTDLSPENKEKFYNFYSAVKKVGSRNKALEEIRKAAEISNYNKVERLTREYNRAVNEQVGKYFNSEDEMPDILREQYNGLFIDKDKYLED